MYGAEAFLEGDDLARERVHELRTAEESLSAEMRPGRDRSRLRRGPRSAPGRDPAARATHPGRPRSSGRRRPGPSAARRGRVYRRVERQVGNPRPARGDDERAEAERTGPRQLSPFSQLKLHCVQADTSLMDFVVAALK